MKSIKYLMALTVLVTSSVAYCMEQKQTGQIKSLKDIAIKRVYGTGQLGEIPIADLKYQAQLHLDLQTIKECRSVDYEKLITIITELDDIEKLRVNYTAHKAWFEAIYHYCGDLNLLFLKRLLLSSAMRLIEQTNYQDAFMQAIVFNDEVQLEQLMRDRETAVTAANQVCMPWQELPLQIAACYGHHAIAKKLLELGGQVNAFDRARKTALMYAAMNNDIDMITMLIEHGADVAAQNEFERDALYYAIRQGHLATIENLMDKGAACKKDSNLLMPAIASRNQKAVAFLLNRHKYSREWLNEALCYAVQCENIETVSLLIAHGADVNNEDIDYSPLMAACIANNAEIAELFLQHGADVNQFNEKDGSSGLIIAVRHGNKKLVQLLIKYGADCDHADQAGGTPLMIAAKHGHTELVSLLARFSKSLDAVNQEGDSALMRAVCHEHVEVAKLLLQAGAAVDQADHNDETPLLVAVAYGNHELVNLLLAFGAEINRASKFKVSPLIGAVLHNRTEMVELLLNAGADIGEADREGNSALHLAISHNNGRLVRLLLDRGANCFLVNKRGETAEYIAARKNNKTIIELINTTLNKN